MRAEIATSGTRRWVAVVTMIITLAATLVVSVPPASASSDPAALEHACPDPIPASGFDDVGRGGTHTHAIDCLLLYEVTQGVTSAQYDPTSAVNREQMATFIARLMRRAGEELPTPSERRFTDVVGTHANNVEALADAGVARGVTTTTFVPRDAVTRAQMATFIDRMLRVLGLSLADASVPFADVAGGTHAPAIGRLAAAGVVQGTSTDIYDPTGPVTRAQMASFMMRAADLLVAAGLLDPFDLGLVEQCIYIGGDESTYECATQNPVVLVLITSDGDTSGCEYEVDVDFGDGTVEQRQVSGIPGDGTAATFEHTYDEAGSYDIAVTGRSLVLGFRCYVSPITYSLLLL